jgi:hypothetical protein
MEPTPEPTPPVNQPPAAAAELRVPSNTPTSPAPLPVLVADYNQPAPLIQEHHGPPPAIAIIPDDDTVGGDTPISPISPNEPDVAPLRVAPAVKFDKATIPSGKKRCRAKRKPKKAPTTTSKRNKQATRKPRRRRPATSSPTDRSADHPHATRSRHALAATKTDPALTTSPYTHMAWHGTAINPDTGKIAEYKELSSCSDSAQWDEDNGEEIGRLFQGIGPKSTMPEGTNTLFFIHQHQVAKNKKTTYIRGVCADRTEKNQVRRVRWTMGGNLITLTATSVPKPPI